MIFLLLDGGPLGCSIVKVCGERPFALKLPFSLRRVATTFGLKLRVGYDQRTLPVPVTAPGRSSLGLVGPIRGQEETRRGGNSGTDTCRTRALIFFFRRNTWDQVGRTWGLPGWDPHGGYPEGRVQDEGIRVQDNRPLEEGRRTALRASGDTMFAVRTWWGEENETIWRLNPR